MAITRDQAVVGTKVCIPTQRTVSPTLPFSAFWEDFKQHSHPPKYLVIASSPNARRVVALEYPHECIHTQYPRAFSIDDLVLYEEPNFTEANQPFCITGSVADLNKFRERWEMLGFKAQHGAIKDSMTLLINLEPGFAPLLRPYCDMFGTRLSHNVLTEGTRILEAAIKHMEVAEEKCLEPVRASETTKPTHYNDTTITALQVIDSWGANFRVGNALKYLQRYTKKGSAVSDLEKAREYISLEIERLQQQPQCGNVPQPAAADAIN